MVQGSTSYHIWIFKFNKWDIVLILKIKIKIHIEVKNKRYFSQETLFTKF